MGDTNPPWREWAAFGTGLVVFIFLFYAASPKLDQTGVGLLAALGTVTVIFILAIAAALAAKRILAAPVAAAGPVDPDIALRSRIAPLILALGAGAIIILALGIILSFVILSWGVQETSTHPVASKIDSLIMSVFSTVLPVLATWVGTVLAFYFTNESYRQAAEASRAAAGANKPVGHPLGDNPIKYEKIAKIEVERREEANEIPMPDVVNLMKPPVTRVIVFEKSNKNPIFIIRQKLIPATWKDATTGVLDLTNRTIKEYRAATGGDATNFGFVPASATLEEAARVLRGTDIADVFVTSKGQQNEETLGWLTDDMLKDY